MTLTKNRRVIGPKRWELEWICSYAIEAYTSITKSERLCCILRWGSVSPHSRVTSDSESLNDTHTAWNWRLLNPKIAQNQREARIWLNFEFYHWHNWPRAMRPTHQRKYHSKLNGWLSWWIFYDFCWPARTLLLLYLGPENISPSLCTREVLVFFLGNQSHHNISKLFWSNSQNNCCWSSWRYHFLIISAISLDSIF